MSMSIDEIAREAMDLAPEKRAELAERLWASLGADERAEIDAAWGEEVERRIDESEQGTARTIPAEEVFARIEERLRARRR